MKDVRNAAGKLVCRFDRDKGIVEIRRKGNGKTEMKIEYAYRFATGDDVTVKVDEAEYVLLRELDRQLYNDNQRETRRHAPLGALDETAAAAAAVAAGGGGDMSGDDPAAVYEKKEDLEALAKALRGLTPEQQRLIRKVFFDGTAPSHIARDEGVDKSAISHRVGRLLKKLRRFLE